MTGRGNVARKGAKLSNNSLKKKKKKKKKTFDFSPKFFSKWQLLCSLFPSPIVLPTGWSLKASIIIPIPFEFKFI